MKKLVMIVALLVSASMGAQAEWKYGDVKDEMGQVPVEHQASVVATTNDAKLILFNNDSNQPTSLGFDVSGHVFASEPVSADLYHVTVLFRLDENRAEQYTLTSMPDFGLNKSLCDGSRLGNFVQRLRSASTLRVQVQLYSVGYRVFTFDVRGLQGRW